MTTTTTLDWDAWRAAYPGMSYAQQQAFHSEIYKHHPTQRHYDPAYVARAIEQVQPWSVVELGGWDGELAHTMLDTHDLGWWTNVEICREAAEKGRGRHPNYYCPEMDDWYWSTPHTADLFVASHTIEHLTVQHLNEAIAATHTKALFLDAPLKTYPLNWYGFTGTHILECGWSDVHKLCAKHGYVLDWAEDHETEPSSGDWSTACLYLKESA